MLKEFLLILILNLKLVFQHLSQEMKRKVHLLC